MSNPNIKTFDWTFNPEPQDEPLQVKGHKLLFFIAIFTIIILFTALFLCARWLFQTHHTPHAPSHTSTFSSSQSEGLNADAIKKLPIILHQSNTSNHALEETECCICLSTFRDGEKVKVLPSCDHYFHCECVDAWLVNHSSCPLCRASLKIDLEFPKILIQEPPIRYNLAL
ncbi:putative transcription factor C2H2 family [Medicago truncatula]|uniref:C3HC4-type RING zinc finger protein n=1 Tax=Medicago truncatula TaxID=3880 RepID=G7K263_MEDTR|nr:RING-H2 finger protein ATL66-like [Medicago truncatula]AES99623.1 C3HC4-type RING zinc finger protein [Medicago truncatula]RHN57158.1 putative transcription factor C2H2 family [Medicago truncatula]